MGNHWVGQSVIKPVDADLFQKIKDIQGECDKKNDNFDMYILEYGDIEKALNVKNQTQYGKQPWKQIHQLIDDEYFNESKLKFSQQFFVKRKAGFNFTQFITHYVRKKITSWSRIWIVFTNFVY